jgi:hypothetical protein
MLVLIGKLTPMGVEVMIVLFAVIIGASIIQLDDEISNSKDGPTLCALHPVASWPIHRNAYSALTMIRIRPSIYLVIHV